MVHQPWVEAIVREDAAPPSDSFSRDPAEAEGLLLGYRQEYRRACVPACPTTCRTGRTIAASLNDRTLAESATADWNWPRFASAVESGQRTSQRAIDRWKSGYAPDISNQPHCRSRQENTEGKPRAGHQSLSSTPARESNRQQHSWAEQRHSLYSFKASHRAI